MALPIYFATQDKTKAVLLALISGLAEPLGVLFVLAFGHVRPIKYYLPSHFPRRQNLYTLKGGGCPSEYISRKETETVPPPTHIHRDSPPLSLPLPRPQEHLTPERVATLLAMVGGVMIGLSLGELLPQAAGLTSPRAAAIGFCAGFVAMAGLLGLLHMIDLG